MQAIPNKPAANYGTNSRKQGLSMESVPHEISHPNRIVIRFQRMTNPPSTEMDWPVT